MSTRMRLKTEAYVSNGQTKWAYSLLKGGCDEVHSTSSGYLSKADAYTAGINKLAELAELAEWSVKRVGR